MPAVHEIISTLNQFAQARLPAAGWRRGSFDATHFIPAGWMRVPPAVPEAPEIAESAYAHAGAEPPLEEVLSDPVVQLIMQADRLQPAEVRRMLAAVRRQRRRAAADPGAICPQ